MAEEFSVSPKSEGKAEAGPVSARVNKGGPAGWDGWARVTEGMRHKVGGKM